MSNEETYICPCGNEFKAVRPRIYCSKECRYSKKSFDENGKFEKKPEDIKKDRDKVKRELGYTNLKNPMDFIREINDTLQKAGLMEANVLEKGQLFTKEFYAFMGFGTPHSYFYPLQRSIQIKVHDMQKLHTLRKDSGEVYSPIDNMYGTPNEGDSWYDYGRIPTSHLVALCTKRLGVANTVCNRPATDMFDNDFEFVERGDPNGDPVNSDPVKDVKKWMDKIFFHKHLADWVEFIERTGNGHLVGESYDRNPEKPADWVKKAPNTRPNKFQTFDAYYMTPYDVFQADTLDYDKQAWKFLGGVHTRVQIHESRVFVGSLRREQYGIRDLALPETCFVSFLCLLNAMFHILKSLGQLGTITVGVQSDKEFPTTTEVTAYLTYLKAMKANNFYVLGRGATLQVENAAGKIGSGVPDLMEFYKEDICAATVFPKNQLFGRSDGGGLDGAGALVSKEDYLNSNISVKFSKIKRDILWILQNMCHFKGLDDLIPKLNIDLHKTEEQRLREGMMREEYEQTKIITQQSKLAMPVYKKQLKLQSEIADIQMKMAKENPEALLQTSDKDEENVKEKTDFSPEYKQLRFDLMVKERQYRANARFLRDLRADTNNLVRLKNQENFANRKYLERERRARD
jgi:hypothetical protein